MAGRDKPLASAASGADLLSLPGPSQMPQDLLIRRGTWLGTALEEFVREHGVVQDADGNCWVQPTIGPLPLVLETLHHEPGTVEKRGVDIPVIRFPGYRSRSGISCLTLRLRMFSWIALTMAARGASVASSSDHDVYVRTCLTHDEDLEMDPGEVLGLLELEGSTRGILDLLPDLSRTVAFKCAAKDAPMKSFMAASGAGGVS
jgi:hypothetical protein